MTKAELGRLREDARNRALRTFLTGLGIDVAVGVALVLVTYVGPLGGWDEFQWTVLSFSLVKSVIQAVGAYILRRFIDGRVPTPVPPAPVPPPNERDAQPPTSGGSPGLSLGPDRP